MYRARGASLKLKDVLAKLKGEAPEIADSAHRSITYSTHEIKAAKRVLDRLLANPERNEVAYITNVVTEIEEE